MQKSYPFVLCVSWFEHSYHKQSLSPTFLPYNDFKIWSF